MKLFGLEIGRKRSVTNNIDDVLLRAMVNGEKIDKDKAMSIGVVSSSIDLIKNTVSSLPIRLYKREFEDSKEKIIEIKDDIRTKLLNDDTGDTLTGVEFKRALVEDYLCDKGGYAYINKRGNKILSLHYVEAKHLSFFVNTNPIFKDYDIYCYGEKYKPFEFIKILRNTKNGAYGKSVIDEVSKTIENTYQTLIYELGLVKTGGNKKGFLSSEKPLTKEAIEALKSAWNKLYQNNESNVVVLNDGMKFQESSNTAVENQIEEKKTFGKAEILDIFHIDKNEQKTIKNAIIPILEEIESALNRDLLLEIEKKNYYFSFDTKSLLRGTPVERADFYQKGIQSGWLNRAEVRELEDMNHIDGLDTFSMSLADVLFDPKTQTYYTPNTNNKTSFNDEIGGDKNESGNKE